MSINIIGITGTRDGMTTSQYDISTDLSDDHTRLFTTLILR